MTRGRAARAPGAEVREVVVPDRFEFVEEIPKTSVGKFKKTELREQFAARTGAGRRRRAVKQSFSARRAGRTGSS